MATVKKILVEWRGGSSGGIEVGKTYKVNIMRNTFKDSNGLERDARWAKWVDPKPLFNAGQPLVLELAPIPDSGKKYLKKITDAQGNTARVDVYDVLKAFNVTDPALQHLIKKALNAGLRGHKDLANDLQDITDSAIRAQQLNKQGN
tara:strand:+ start:495 stop:935 length:441 start_codon:yes stop_codon:yes gene_type:complete